MTQTMLTTKEIKNYFCSTKKLLSSTNIFLHVFWGYFKNILFAYVITSWWLNEINFATARFKKKKTLQMLH